MGLAAALDLKIENVGSASTFQGLMSKSISDVTFSRLTGSK